jgi:tetratricopeptide (TPR) repeat protein
MLVSGVVMLWSCAQPPTQEMDAAKAAIEKAVTAGADIYAVTELEAAKTLFAQAEQKVNAKDYEGAKADAKEAVAKATAAEAAVVSGKEAVKSEIDTMVPGVEKAYAELQKQVKAAKANKKAALQLKSTLDEIPALETELKDAKTAYDAGDFAGAKDKYTAAKMKIDDSTKSITKVVGVAKKPVPTKKSVKKPVKKAVKKTSKKKK